LPYKYSTTTPARERTREGEKGGEAERINKRKRGKMNRKGKERTDREGQLEVKESGP
jgi:hypothetical protein